MNSISFAIRDKRCRGLYLTICWLTCCSALAQTQSEPDDAKLVFSSLEVDQTNRGTININGYDFAPVTTPENVLIGMRIKDCGHGFRADQYQSDFFRIFSQQNGDLRAYDNKISRDTAMRFC